MAVLLAVVAGMTWLLGGRQTAAVPAETAPEPMRAATAGTVSDQASGDFSVRAYPPPYATTTPTPTPDGGFLPVPAGVTTTVTSLAASPYANLLVPMQESLDTHDAQWFANQVLDTLTLSQGKFEMGEVWNLLPDDVETLLDDYFNNGSAPIVQGYYIEAESTNYACLNIVTFPWVGPVEAGPNAFPTAPGDPAGSDYFPVLTDNAGWSTWCSKELGSWNMHSWNAGEYYDMVETYMYYDPATTVYYMIRP